MRMSVERPPYVPLIGSHVRLEPFTEQHIPALYDAIGHPDVFAGGYGGGPSGLPASADAFAEWIVRYVPRADGNPYVVIVSDGGPLDGVVVGTTSLADFELGSESAHLGWTAYDPRVWGTVVNAEAKLLLLGHAFDHGFGRVKLQADVLNVRSRAAIEGIGASFEGIARRHKPRADGTWRDSAVFSVIDTDWPGVRELLVDRVARRPDPVAYRRRS